MNKKFNLRVEEIRNLILNAKNPVMFFDTDTDGSTSYLQVKRNFKHIIGYPMDKDIKRQKSLIYNYINSDTDLVLIFDVPFLYDEFLEKIKDKKIIWVDHHPTNLESQIKKFDIIHLNPLNYDKNDNRPTCFLANEIAGKWNNLDLLGLGAVSDFFLLDNLSKLYLKDKFAFNLIFNGIDDTIRRDIFSFIQKYKFNDKRVNKQREEYIRYLSYGTNLKNIKNFFDFICKFEEEGQSIKAFRTIENMQFKDLISSINSGSSFPFKEFSDKMKEYKIELKKAENFGEKEIFFYEYEGKQSFAKTMSEELNFKFNKSKIVCVSFRKFGKDWHSLSIRSRSIPINDIVSESLRGLEGRGGGHPMAAGAAVNKKDFLKFKKIFLNKIQKRLNN